MKGLMHGKLKAALILLFILSVSTYFVSSVYATTDETINLQGKIVRNDSGYEGLNVSAGSPSCVVAGAGNDTCDFRVRYYTAATSGTLLGTETFSNKEIGTYYGVFNLVLGTGSFSAGSETSFRNVFLNNADIFVEMAFAPAGDANFTETFLDASSNRLGARAVAAAFVAAGATKQFQMDVAASESGYSNVAEGQVYYDSTKDSLRFYNGTGWYTVLASSTTTISSLWEVNTGLTPDLIYAVSPYDFALGGTDDQSPFFYDVSTNLLTLTNTQANDSFRVYDVASDTTPFIIDADGDVGIGTATASYKLHVVGGQSVLSYSTSQALGINNSGNTGVYWIGTSSSASTPSMYFINHGGTTRLELTDNGTITGTAVNGAETGLFLGKATTDTTHIQWKLANQSNNTDFWISGYNGATTKNYIKFFWSTSAPIANFADASVGIGVDSPNAFLDIKAATASSAQINLTTSAGTNPSTPVSGDLWWNGTQLYFYDGDSSENLLASTSLFTDGGDVTYLTSTTDDFALGGSTSAAPLFFDEGAELLTLTNTTAGVSFRVNDVASDTTPFVIDADGNVGIGTSTPSAKLDVTGTSSTISNSAGDITIDAYSGYISFAGDSLSNVLNATFSGNVVVNGGQLQLGTYSTKPTAIGTGTVVYDTTNGAPYVWNGSAWKAISLGSYWVESGTTIYNTTGNVGIGDSSPDTTLKVTGSLCVKSDANNCAGSTAGTIYANNTTVQSADLAELYGVTDASISAGDLVSVSQNVNYQVEKANISNSSNIMGVVSTAPGVLMNDGIVGEKRPIALLGRVPVKVVIGSTNIYAGDILGVSPIDGYGSKQNMPGFTAAKAIDNTLTWNEEICPTVESASLIVWPADKGENENHPCFRVPILSFTVEQRAGLMDKFALTEDDFVYLGKIMGYVSVQWYQPQWITDGLAEVITNYNGGLIGDGSTIWTVDGERMITNMDVVANSFNSNYGSFNVLSGGILNIGTNKFTVDTGGNISVAGDILLSGAIKGKDGNIMLTLGDSDGANLFAISNSNGETVFSVDSKGEVGGSGVYKTGWVKVLAGGDVSISHNFGKTPSDISMITSGDSEGTTFSTKGVGTTYYFESLDINTIKVFNTSGSDIFVKLTIQR